jgi:hypothetical protein
VAKDTMSFASLTDAAAVAMSSGVHNTVRSLLKRFLKMVTVVKTQQIFCKHFNTAHYSEVPCPNTIQLSASEQMFLH